MNQLGQVLDHVDVEGLGLGLVLEQSKNVQGHLGSLLESHGLGFVAGATQLDENVA